MTTTDWQGKEFTSPRVIVCEGGADAAFLRAIIKHRNLPDFNVRNPEDRRPPAKGGIDQIGDLVSGFAITRGFSDVRHILILVDSDLDPRANFEKICRQIAAVATYTFEVPSRPSQPGGGVPSITVSLVPADDRPGNLESFCLEAALSGNPGIAGCVEQFAACTGATTWPEQTKLDKMKLRSFLAAAYRPDPSIGIGRVWPKAGYLIPLGHPSFDALAMLLESYRSQ